MANRRTIRERAGHEEFNDLYKIGHEIGVGAESVVYECRNTSTSEKCAVKVSEITKVDTRMLEAECAILSSLDHENIIKGHGIFYVKDKVHLVTELVDGEEMHEVIRQSGGIPEEDAIPLIHQLLVAVKYLHAKNVCHRDIKPENILISTDGTLKLIDFGLAVDLSGTDGIMKASVGTQAYQAPEVLIGMPYGINVDMWAIGATTFTLLSGYKPFGYGPHENAKIDFSEGPTPEQKSHQRAKILNGDYNFADAVWSNVSEEGKDFVTKLMKVRPTDRITAAQALDHPWLTSKGEIDLRSFHFQWRSKSRDRREAARKERREQLYAQKHAERSNRSTSRQDEDDGSDHITNRRLKANSILSNRTTTEPRATLSTSHEHYSPDRSRRPEVRDFSTERSVDRSSYRSTEFALRDHSTDRSYREHNERAYLSEHTSPDRTSMRASRTGDRSNYSDRTYERHDRTERESIRHGTKPDNSREVRHSPTTTTTTTTTTAGTRHRATFTSPNSPTRNSPAASRVTSGGGTSSSGALTSSRRYKV